MAPDLEPRKSFPIPCRKCGKLSIVPIESGSRRLTCIACNRVTQLDVKQVGQGWEIRTSLSAATHGFPKNR